MGTALTIANRALQKVGSTARFTSFDGTTALPASKAATEMQTAYLSLKLAELRMNRWKFAITRAKIESDLKTMITNAQTDLVTQSAVLTTLQAAAVAVGAGDNSANVTAISASLAFMRIDIDNLFFLGYDVATANIALTSAQTIIAAAVLVGVGNNAANITALGVQEAIFIPLMAAFDFDSTKADSDGAISLGVKPLFGRVYQFTLPANWLKDAQLDPQISMLPLDYMYEGQKILTDDPGPIFLRYIVNDADESVYDPLFDEALSARLAFELCETLTQSNSKKDELGTEYALFVSTARRTNAIELGPTMAAVDEWEYVRQVGGPWGPGGRWWGV